MFSLNFLSGGAFPGSAAILAIVAIYYLIWLFVLGAALGRVDLEPVLRLMWVVVIIFVPVAGMLFYGFMAPERRHDRKRDPRRVNVTRPDSGTPWQKKSSGQVQDHGE